MAKIVRYDLERLYRLEGCRFGKGKGIVITDTRTSIQVTKNANILNRAMTVFEASKIQTRDLYYRTIL